MQTTTIEQDLAVLTRGCERIETLDELRKKLERSKKTGKPLRIKLGLDPTAPDIHLGHTVVLRKMRQFQDLGHKAVLIIGDYTARIGDPSGRSKTRPVLDDAAVKANAQTYFEQAGRVLDTSPEKLEIRYNSEWLGPMTFADVLRLAGQMTVGQMLKRDDFRKRFESETPIGVHEFMYPLMQGWDSVCIQSDVELGGNDQTFNNLVGRDLQRGAGQEPQIVMIMPILVGLDGKEKMSKSLGNYVGVTESPHDMFGKLMSVPDEVMANYFTVLTSVPQAEITELTSGRVHPMEAKKRLAVEITTHFHGAELAQRARAEWEAIHQKKASSGELVVPADTPTVTIGGDLLKDGTAATLEVIVKVGFAASKSEARKLVEEKGFRVNGTAVEDPLGRISLKSGDILQRGKRKFVRVELS
jgi:tyrosyl-tRNA synthetase